MSNVLKVTNLMAKVEEKDILKGVDLEIKTGEIHAIMGPNGTGKSTLSSIIMGQRRYEVTGGDVTLDGVSLLDKEVDERARMGLFLAYQNPAEVPGVTNSDFLRADMKATSGTNPSLFKFIQEYAKAISDLKMREDLGQRYLNDGFSGGEKKKNEILQMKMLKPKFIIFDELDSGLDVDSLKVVCDNINEYLKEYPETSVLFITHYTRILEFIKPNFVHMMKDGTIIQSGDYSLAQKIEKYGYNETFDLGDKDALE